MTQMVRTQIYLPRDLYDQLRLRGARDGIAMAEQIRVAVRQYLVERAAATVLSEDDPLWSVIGRGEGPPDAADQHDRYLYGTDGGPA